MQVIIPAHLIASSVLRKPVAILAAGSAYPSLRSRSSRLS